MIKQNTLKRCPKCKEWKSRTRFYKNASSKDGLTHYCKECKKIVQKESDKRRATKNRKRNKGKDVTIGPPKKCRVCGKLKPRTEFSKHSGRQDGLQVQCTECVGVYLKTHHIKHREKHNKRAKDWYIKNREKVRVFRFLYGNTDYAGFLKGSGCCLYCFEINPLKLRNHHVWGIKNSDEKHTFCANCHEVFTRNKSAFLEFLADL